MNNQSPLLEELLIALRRINHSVELHSRSLERQYGLTTPQYIILKELVKKERITGSELAQVVKYSQSTVTGILDRLEKKTYISRIRCKNDRRKVIVTITDVGRELCKHASALFFVALGNEFHRLDDWEQAQIVSSIQRIASMIEIPSRIPRRERNSAHCPHAEIASNNSVLQTRIT